MAAARPASPAALLSRGKGGSSQWQQMAEGPRPRVKELRCLLQTPLPALRVAQPITRDQQWLLAQRSPCTRCHQIESCLPAQGSVREAPLPPGCLRTGPCPAETGMELSQERGCCPSCEVKNNCVLQGDAQILTVQLRETEPSHPVLPQTRQFSPC